MNFMTIKKCRICSSSHFTTIIDLGLQCLSGIFPKNGEQDPPSCPLELVKCNECDLVQLRHSVNPSLMFTESYGYRSGINTTMRTHLKDVVKSILLKISLQPGDCVLDIGCNDGTLLHVYDSSLIRIGIDPVANKFRDFYDDNIIVIPDFFSKTSLEKNHFTHAKVITSISMFYDLEDPVDFALNIKQCLSEDGIWVFEQSYLPMMMERNSFDTICHEHLEYYALKQIDYILKKANLKIIDLDFNKMNGGSIRIYAGHMQSPHPVSFEKIEDIKEKEQDFFKKNVYESFKKNCAIAAEKIFDFIKSERALGKTIHVYGASTKGNIILQYAGIDSSLIEFAAERNPEKFGCRTPGTHIKIISEEDSRAKKPDYLLVLPWHLKNEFIERESAYGAKIIFPLPELSVI